MEMVYKRIVVLDVDGVLAAHGQPISREVAVLLKKISKISTLAFASGKPAPYLEGLARGIGLRDTIVVGENGGVIYIPQKELLTQFPEGDDKIKQMLSNLEWDLQTNLGKDILFQQNVVNITIFPKRSITVSKIQKECDNIFNRHPSFKDFFKMYVHVDSVDLVPKKLDKGWALDVISNEMDISISKFIAVGDGPNDLELLKKVNLYNGLSICVGNDPELLRFSRKKFKTGHEALKYILNYFEYFKNKI